MGEHKTEVLRVTGSIPVLGIFYWLLFLIKMFRSKEMVHYHVAFPRDEAWEVVDKLGCLGLLHFEDKHEGDIASHRPFAVQVADIIHTLGKLDEIEQILRDHGHLGSSEGVDEELCKTLLLNVNQELRAKSTAEYFETLKSEIYIRSNIVKTMVKDYKTIEAKVIDSRDYISALETFNDGIPASIGLNRGRYESLDVKVQLDYILGVIPNEELAKFQRSLFRLTRGNAYANYSNIKAKAEVRNKESIPNKTVFFVAFASPRGEVLYKRLRRLCETMNARVFEIPDNVFDLSAELDRAYKDNIEATKVLRTTEEKIYESLRYFIAPSEGVTVPYYLQIRVGLLKQLSVYETLNKFSQRNNFVEGYFWVPHDDELKYQEFVYGCAKSSVFAGYRHCRLDHRKIHKEPPTLIRTNAMTEPFQEIVNTYGVPVYKEANPGLFTVISFPFLFGVMFGDVGHGSLLTAFSISLFLAGKTFMPPLRPFRYLLLFMGIMATFCGLIYNEFLSIPIPLFPSCYTATNGEYARKGEDCVYPVGFDHTWESSGNAVTFVNSFKMKLSIIVGVLHMLLGILMKGLNAIYFRNLATFCFEFIPQFIFMLVTFGYMCFCIIVKWLTRFDDTSKAPSIIALFINLVGKVDEPLYGNSELQELVQRTLVITAVVCLPLMWLAKPLITYVTTKGGRGKGRNSQAENANRLGRRSVSYDDDEVETLMSHRNLTTEDDTHDESDDMTELFVHQSIETIEFILGSVSNTASYLRLWALSLAHSQLAKVFLEMLVKPFYEGTGNPYVNAVGLVLLFFVFLIVTIAVLMLMDVMECFLHALRLHWVEFQNKFYKGTGYKFQEFEHTKTIMNHMQDR